MASLGTGGNRGCGCASSSSVPYSPAGYSLQLRPNTSLVFGRLQQHFLLAVICKYSGLKEKINAERKEKTNAEPDPGAKIKEDPKHWIRMQGTAVYLLVDVSCCWLLASPERCG